MRTISRVLILLGICTIIGLAYGFGAKGRAQTITPLPAPGCVGGKVTIPAGADSSYQMASVQDLMSSRDQDECNLVKMWNQESQVTLALQARIAALEAKLSVTPPTCNPPNTLVNGVCTPPAPPICNPPSTMVNGVCTPPSGPPPAGTLAIGATVKVVSPCPTPCHMWPDAAVGGGVSGIAIPLNAGDTGKVLAGPRVTGNGGIWWQVQLPNGTGWLDPGFVIAQ